MTPVAHLDREHRPPGGAGPRFCPALLALQTCPLGPGPPLWLPAQPPYTPAPCLSTHPSVRLSTADLCVHAVPPGLAGGRAPGLLGGVRQACWLQPPRPPAPGSCSAPAFTRLSPELGRPAGQAAGLTEAEA